MGLPLKLTIEARTAAVFKAANRHLKTFSAGSLLSSLALLPGPDGTDGARFGVATQTF